jgi:hypothetical protein
MNTTAKDIVVEVRGGCLVAMYCDDPSVRFVVVEWDDLNELPLAKRKASAWPSDPLAAMPSDTREVYQRAGA